jgi:hypothetical protein
MNFKIKVESTYVHFKTTISKKVKNPIFFHFKPSFYETDARDVFKNLIVVLEILFKWALNM